MQVGSAVEADEEPTIERVRWILSTTALDIVALGVGPMRPNEVFVGRPSPFPYNESAEAPLTFISERVEASFDCSCSNESEVLLLR